MASDSYGPDGGGFERVFADAVGEILYSEKDVDELESEFQNVFEYGGLEVVSHLYGLNERENQFDDLFSAYREFYRVKDFREGSRVYDERLHGLMEAYRDFFGPGSNEQWNEGLETASLFAMTGDVPLDRPLGKDEFRQVLEEF